MKKRSILIADDDCDFANMLQKIFENHDYIVFKAFDGKKALEIYHQYHPQLALLDIDIPGIDGMELTKTIREVDVFTPIIILTGFRIEEQDSLECYQLGINLFLRKPVTCNEIYACINSMMGTVYGPISEVIRLGDFELDVQTYVLTDGTDECKLSERETKTLQLLFRHKNQVVSREDLVGHLWQNGAVDDNIQMLRNTITYLKKRLRTDPSLSIEVIYGKGYILKDLRQ